MLLGCNGPAFIGEIGVAPVNGVAPPGVGNCGVDEMGDEDVNWVLIEEGVYDPVGAVPGERYVGCSTCDWSLPIMLSLDACVSARASAAAISEALVKRADGSFCRLRRMTSDRAGEICGLISEGVTGST